MIPRLRNGQRRVSLTAACCVLMFLGGMPARGAEPLAERIGVVIGTPEFKHARWGILIADLKSGETIYELNADQLFIPASTTKLFSVAAAMDALGADYRFETPVHARGTIDEQGRLKGDLILRASGDLNLGGRTDNAGDIAFTNSDHTYAGFADAAELTKTDPLAGLNELARQVAATGIQHLQGEVLIDDRLFESATGTGSGPSRLTPIMVNDNLLDFLIAPAEAGQPARVVSRPATAAYAIDARVETVEAGEPTRVQVSSPGPGRIVVRGQIPAGRKPLVRIYEVEDAAAFARALFIEALRRAGVDVEASILTANPRAQLPSETDYAQLRRVALLKSPRFAESARLVLKVSHNLHASTLPLLVAAKNGKRTLSEGLRLQHDFLVRSGIDAETLSFGGGAGGDRADHTTPRATVQLLRAMAVRKDFADYRAALPVLGIDGTLAQVVDPESPARGKIQAKTGTLLWPNTMNGSFLLTSKALGGYAARADGREVAFAMFVNNVHLKSSTEIERIGRTLGKLCEQIHESP